MQEINSSFLKEKSLFVLEWLIVVLYPFPNDQRSALIYCTEDEIQPSDLQLCTMYQSMHSSMNTMEGMTSHYLIGSDENNLTEY